MSSFYTKLYELADSAPPQVAMDLGVLAGFLSDSANTEFHETREAARASLLRLARLLVVEQGDDQSVDLDDAMDEEDDAAAAAASDKQA